MPELSGLELAQAITALGAALPIVLVSGYAPQVDDQLAAAGVHHRLAKPFDLDALAELFAPSSADRPAELPPCRPRCRGAAPRPRAAPGWPVAPEVTEITAPQNPHSTIAGTAPSASTPYFVAYGAAQHLRAGPGPHRRPRRRRGRRPRPRRVMRPIAAFGPLVGSGRWAGHVVDGDRAAAAPPSNREQPRRRRTASRQPSMPRARLIGLAASTIRWRWLPSTLKWTTRKSSRCPPAAIAARTARDTLAP